MPFRVLYYVTQIWEMQRKEWEAQKIPLHQWRFRPILPVVFYTGSQPWETPLEMKSLVDLPASLERFVPQQEILFLNLKATVPERLVAGNNPFGWVLRVIQKEEAAAEEFREALRLAVEHLSQMPQEERANWEKLMRFLLALIYHRREQEERAGFLNLVETTVSDKSRREEVGQMGKTIAQAFIEEGKELGAVEARQEMLIELLKSKFREIPQSVFERIQTLQGVDEIHALQRQALTAQTIEELRIK